MMPSMAKRVVRLHARLLLDAGSSERTAQRLRTHDPDRAEMVADQAAESRAEAEALADLLREAGVEVHIAPAGQLALFSDGGAA
jgi:hypothetical protein